MQEWHYTQNGASAGPVSAAELKQLAARGTIQPTDLVWKEGMANWVPATSIKGLFPAPGAPPQAPRPPSYADVPPPPPGPAVAASPAPVAWQAKAQGLTGKAKTVWKGWTTPVKVIVVCSAVGVVLLFMMFSLLLCIGVMTPTYHSPYYPSLNTPVNNGPGAARFPVVRGVSDGTGDDPLADKASVGRQKLTQAELDGMSFNDIENRLGAPAESYQGNIHSNVKLDVWEQGDGMFTVLSYIEAIDGSGQVIVATKKVDRPRYVVENLITTVHNQ